MRQSQTAVLERGFRLENTLETEPFEAAWAGEARWFVQFLEESDTTVTLTTQISADGLIWADHEDASLERPARGVVTAPVHDFGSWLRLVVTRADGGASPFVRVYLALKE